MMFGVLTKARREGNLAIEQDIEVPQESEALTEFLHSSRTTTPAILSATHCA